MQNYANIKTGSLQKKKKKKGSKALQEVQILSHL